MNTLQLPVGFNLVELDEVDSTNRYAKKLANSGAMEGTIVLAHQQSAGQGRQGRQWISKRGNLFVSLILRPNCSPLRALQFSFISALAIRDMILPYLYDPNSAKLKWPNDVLISGRKVSGILLESSTPAKGNVDWLVIGIGINLAHHYRAIISIMNNFCYRSDVGLFSTAINYFLTLELFIRNFG